MPVTVRRLDLGSPPQRTITRGPMAGQTAPALEVILPGWNDIIKVQSTAALTPSEAALERQRRNAQLNRSPTPEVVKNFAKIGQEIDNVQDALVTLSVAGRIASSLIGRTIPGVGQIATAADVVNMLNVFYPKSAREALVGAATRAGAKVSGRKKYLASKEVKRALGLAPDASLSTYLRRLEETLKTGKVNVGLGELLQIGQTAEQVTGYGIALGPIFGAMQDTFFGLIRGARFDLSGPLALTGPARTVESLEHMRQFAPGEYQMYEQRARDLAQQQRLPFSPDPARVARILAHNPVRVQVDFPGIIPAVDILRGAAPGTTEADIKPYLDPAVEVINKGAVAALDAIGAAKKASVSAALKVYNGMKWLVGVRGDLSWSDHVELLCAQILAQQELMPLTAAADWSIPVAFLSRESVESLPFCGGDHVHARDVGSVANCLARGPGRLAFDWVDEAPSTDARDFTVALIDLASRQVFELLEGPEAKVVQDNGPHWKALWLLHEFDLLPPYDRSDEETFTFIKRVVMMYDLLDRDQPLFSDIKTLYQASFPGVELD